MIPAPLRERFIREVGLLGSTPVAILLVLLAWLLAGPSLAWRLALTLALALIGVIVLRALIPGERPRKRHARGLLARLDARSYPSAHAARAAAVGALLTLAYPSFFTALIALTLTALVCASRVHLGEHRWADVLAGALLGTLAALAITAKSL